MAANTIILKGQGLQEEAPANAAITPGHLVELMSTGKIKVHATAAGNAEKTFAVEDELQGNGIDDAYAEDDRVPYRVFERGAWVNAILADSQTVVVGDSLESAGSGQLRKVVPQAVDEGGAATYDVIPNPIVGVAMAAVTTDGATARIAVRIA